MTQANGDSVPAQVDSATLAGTWVLDPARSTVRLRSKSMWGLVPVKGSFGTVSGEGTVSPAGEVSGTVTVDAASVDTKMGKRDQHLRSETSSPPIPTRTSCSRWTRSRPRARRPPSPAA